MKIQHFLDNARFSLSLAIVATALTGIFVSNQIFIYGYELKNVVALWTVIISITFTTIYSYKNHKPFLRDPE